MICLIRNELVPFVTHTDVNKYVNFCVFVIDKKLFGLENDMLYVCSYVPPEGSPFYTYFDLDSGISVLEDCLTDCLLTKDVYVILCGDLNSRISTVS